MTIESIFTLGFSLISLCGVPFMVRAAASVLMQVVLPEPLGPRTMMPCLEEESIYFYSAS